MNHTPDRTSTQKESQGRSRSHKGHTDMVSSSEGGRTESRRMTTPNSEPRSEYWRFTTTKSQRTGWKSESALDTRTQNSTQKESRGRGGTYCRLETKVGPSEPPLKRKGVYVIVQNIDKTWPMDQTYLRPRTRVFPKEVEEETPSGINEGGEWVFVSWDPSKLPKERKK